MYLLPKDSSPTPPSPPPRAPTRSSLKSKTEKCTSRLTETLSSQNGNSESCGITHSCFFPFSGHHNKSKKFTIKDPKLLKIKEIHHWKNQLSTRLLSCVKCWALTKRLLIACNLAQSRSSACIIKNKIIAVLSIFFFSKGSLKTVLRLVQYSNLWPCILVHALNCSTNCKTNWKPVIYLVCLNNIY